MNVGRWLTLGLYVAHLARLAWVYPTLPEIVATHFDGRGQADGWMTRSSHVTTSVLLGAFPILFGFGVAALVRGLPVAWVNLPHKDHWLVGAQREASLAWLDRYFSAIGAGLMAFLALVLALVDGAQGAGEPSLPMGPFLAGLAAVVGGVLASLWALNRRFPAPPAA